MLNHPVIRQIREQLDRLKHLENIECVPPMRKEETLGVGITFSVDDLAAVRDADAAVIQIEVATAVNSCFDSTIQYRESDGTWSDGDDIWALDLESASSLTLGNRYIAVAVRDEFGNAVSEAQGPHYVSIDVGYGHELSDTAWWIKVVGSLTPASWSGVTAYVVGNLVTSGGDDYVCISAHTNHVPPNTTYWVPVVLNDAGSYDGTKAYVAGDYVQELRRLWAFSSATGGGGGSSGSITTDSGTATGPDYTFAQSGVITISATGSTVTFNVPTTPPPIYVQGGIYEPFLEVTFDNPIPAWSSGTTYDIGEIVDVSGTTYISTKTANTNHNPSTPSPLWWASVGSTASLQGETRLLIGEGGDFPNGGTFAGLIHNGTQTVYGSKTFRNAYGLFRIEDSTDETSTQFEASSLGAGTPETRVITSGIDSYSKSTSATARIIPATTNGTIISTHSRFVFDGGYTDATGYPASQNPCYALRVYAGGPGSTTDYNGAWATVSGLVFKGGLYISGAIDGDAITYTPSTSSNWGSSPPSTIVDAIDLVSTIVNAYIPTNAPKSYTTPGSYDRIISTDGNYEIKCYGGGGGGGGGSAGTGGDGGGGGEYASETVALRVGDVITIVVGDGGAGGTAGNSGVGGTQSSVASRSGSSFTTVSANGGSGGAPAGAGTGGQGGTGSTNTTHTNGGNGTTGNGTNGGTGGASGLQSGAAGGTGSNTGSAGTSGAGGGGGGPTNGVGGAGGNGVVIIEKV